MRMTKNTLLENAAFFESQRTLRKSLDKLFKT